MWFHSTISDCYSKKCTLTHCTLRYRRASTVHVHCTCAVYSFSLYVHVQRRTLSFPLLPTSVLSTVDLSLLAGLPFLVIPSQSQIELSQPNASYALQRIKFSHFKLTNFCWNLFWKMEKLSIRIIFFCWN
jgi:hypothetical protein